MIKEGVAVTEQDGRVGGLEAPEGMMCSFLGVLIVPFQMKNSRHQRLAVGNRQLANAIIKSTQRVKVSRHLARVVKQSGAVEARQG